jgi:serine/threonine protein kinase
MIVTSVLFKCSAQAHLASQKIADFSLAKSARLEPLSQCPLTSYCATRWYRAPELLLGVPYGSAMDCFAFGCIIAEMIRLVPLFPGQTEVDQLIRYAVVLGFPHSRSLPATGHLDTTFWPEGAVAWNDRCRLQGWSLPTVDSGSDPSVQLKREPLPACLPNATSSVIDLVEGLLRLNPSTRYTTADVLAHPFIRDFGEALPPGTQEWRTEASERIDQTTPSHSHRSPLAPLAAQCGQQRPHEVNDGSMPDLLIGHLGDENASPVMVEKSSGRPLQGKSGLQGSSRPVLPSDLPSSTYSSASSSSSTITELASESEKSHDPSPSALPASCSMGDLPREEGRVASVTPFHAPSGTKLERSIRSLEMAENLGIPSIGFSVSPHSARKRKEDIPMGFRLTKHKRNLQ